MQVVSQLELQLQKERDRLQAMMQHLHMTKQQMANESKAEMQRVRVNNPLQSNGKSFNFVCPEFAAEYVSGVDEVAWGWRQYAATAGAAAARVQRATHAARDSAGSGGGALAHAAPADADHGRSHQTQNQ